MAFKDAAQTWNRRFADAGLLFGAEPNHFLRAQADVWTPGQRVLCVADGEGRNSIWLAQQGLQVSAFDISDVGVEKARAWAERAGVAVDFHVADGDQWSWAAEQFDGVAAIFVQFADPAMRQRMFDGIHRTLRPGGALVLQGYTPRQLEYRTGGPGQIEHLYTEAQLRAELAGFDIVHLRAYEDDLDEGTGHHGRSALIGLVARKPATPLSIENPHP